MLSKTRDNLIDAAKQVFILKGVDNTTISDIANASDRGRRTIYAYFKNKKEIFRAVIDRESDKIVLALRQIVDSDMSAREKLSAYMRAHVGKYGSFSVQNQSLRNFFSLDFLRTERMRKLVIDKEEAILAEILKQGIENGEFDPDQARRLSRCLYPLLHGAEQVHLNAGSSQIDSLIESAIEFCVNGVKKT